MKAVDITGVVVHYPSKKVALPDMQVGSGERLFIYGKSGSGKSTLLSLLAGILLPKEGKVKVLGEDIGKMKTLQRDRFRADNIGYIFQQFNLISYLSVYENIELGVSMSKLRSASPKDIELLSKKLDISNVLQNSANQISVGQAQRTACARALLGQPKIILADEPTSALDADNRENFLQLLFASLQEDTTLLFVSHDRSLEKNFDRSLELEEVTA